MVLEDDGLDERDLVLIADAGRLDLWLHVADWLADLQRVLDERWVLGCLGSSQLVLLLLAFSSFRGVPVLPRLVDLCY